MDENRFVTYAPDINLEYLKNIKLMSMNSLSESFEYNALDIYKVTVNSVKDVYDDLINDICKYNKLNIPFTIGISSAMGSLKTTTLKEVFRYLIDNDIAIPLYISPMNLINYQQLLNNQIIKDDRVVYEFLSQKYFVGESKDDTDFKNITGDVIYSNLNHFRKLIDLMRKNNKKFVVVLDECHIIITDYLFRNTNLSSVEILQIMSEFELLINECMDFKSDNGCIGNIFLSATMEPLSNSKDILFTKMYDLDIPKEKRVQVSLMEPLNVDKINMENIFNIIVRTLEKTNRDSIQIINWNTSLKNMKSLREKLKGYQVKTGNLKDIDFDTELEILHSDNIKGNETYESIKNRLKIPKNIKIIIATSIISSGINIEEHERTVDMTIFCNDETFTKSNEVQIVGRVRTGIRLLQIVTPYSSKKNIMYYKTFIEKERDPFIKEVEAGINFLNQLRNIDTEASKRKRLATYKTKDLTNVYNYINVVNNQFKLSKFALMSYLYLTYNKEHVLKSIKGLSNAIYHHKALTIHFVREPQVLDFKDKENVYEQISKTKPPSSCDKNNDGNKNEVKDIKRNANNELVKLLMNEIKLSEASLENQYNYNLLKTRDYKFEVIQKANLEENKELSIRIVEKYLKDDCSKTKLEGLLKEYKITLNLETVNKTKDKKSREMQVKSLSGIDKDNYTAYQTYQILHEIYDNNVEWSTLYIKKKERARIYNFLLEQNALKTYEVEETDSRLKKKYLGLKKQDDELKRCLNLCLVLKKRKGELSFEASSIRKINNN